MRQLGLFGQSADMRTPDEIAREYLLSTLGIGTPTINSISGGKTSSYMAIHYPADYTVFALVRTNHPSHAITDPGLLNAIRGKCPDFVGSLELPDTLRCVLELEQKIGHEIHWVWGENFEDLEPIRNRGYLPNQRARFCTTELKYIPIFDWVTERWPNEICEMRLGMRADEPNRVFRLCGGKQIKGWDWSELGKCESHPRSRRKIEWRFRQAPLYLDGVSRADVKSDPWIASQPFPPVSNCSYCPFHTRKEHRRQFESYPERAKFWTGLEEITWNTFHKDYRLAEILHSPELTLLTDDLRQCDCTD